MNEKFAFATISRETFDTVLAQYPDVLPEELLEFDEQRYSTIPATVAERERAGEAHLTKDEAFTLVTWKLSHGKFRPTLKALLQQNSEEAVATATRTGFTIYNPEAHKSVKPSIEALSQLRGIGPATASLFLSVYAPETAPFFSVGILGWFMDKKGHGKDWEAGVKYNVKEYLEIFERVSKIRERLGVKAVEVEKVGYVLGHTGQGSLGEGLSKEAESTGKKRKAEAIKEETKGQGAAETTTRSTRRKKR